MKIIYKPLLMLALTLFLATGCASLKNKYTPAGTWDYLVKDTPMGDAVGTMNIIPGDDGFTGKLVTDNFGEGEMENLTIVDNQLTASVYLSGPGITIDLKGLFEGETFTGSVNANGDEFAMTATRKVVQ